MNKKLKLISLVLLCTISITIISGCSKNKDSASMDATSTSKTVSTAASGGTPLPIFKEKTTLKYFYPLGADATKYIKDMNDNHVFKWLEEKTNVHIEFVHPPTGQEQDQFNIMVASGDVPDMMYMNNCEYPGGSEKGVDDGVFLKLNDYMDKDAPNYKKVRADNPGIGRETATDTGSITGFYMVEKKIQGPWMGMVVRQDWLDELKLSTPVTIDDLHNVLTQFKQKKGATMLWDKSGYQWTGDFAATFGGSNDFINNGGKVEFGPIKPGMKEYFATLAQWYKEGLIDKDFATRDVSTNEAEILNNKTGYWFDGFWTIDNYKKKASAPNFRVVGISQPLIKAGDKLHLRQTNFANRGNYTSVSPKSKYKEEAIKWLDYLYSPEATIVANYGLPNESQVKKADGTYTVNELISKNKDGIPPSQAENIFALQNSPFLRDVSREDIQKTPDGAACEGTWSKNADGSWAMPPITRTVDEGAKYAAIMNDIKTYRDEMAVKFILGKEPISKFDDYVKQMKTMKIDEAIKIQQGALDRFNSRK